jgi:hypothetical protein
MWASIEINHLANEVEITLANDGQGDDRGWDTAIGRTVPLKDGKYPRSGECIVERPSNTDRLANFGQVHFVNHAGGRTCGLYNHDSENYFQLNATGPLPVTTDVVTMLGVVNGRGSSPLATVNPRSDTDPIVVTWRADK